MHDLAVEGLGTDTASLAEDFSAGGLIARSANDGNVLLFRRAVNTSLSLLCQLHSVLRRTHSARAGLDPVEKV